MENQQFTQKQIFTPLVKQDKQDTNRKPSIKEVLQPEIDQNKQLHTKSLDFLQEQKNFLEIPVDLDKGNKQQIHKILEDEKEMNLELINKNDGVVERISRQERDVEIHSCGCGQSYKSYSALFTHIRNKHNKIVPEGTTKQTQNSSKRGRPKKPIESIREDDKNNNIEVNLEKLLHGIINQDEQKQKNIQYFENQVEREDIQNFLSSLKNDYTGYCNPFEGLPVFRNCDNLCIQQHPFINYMIEIKEGLNFENNKIQKESCCDLIMSIFLLNIANLVNLKLYRMINLVFRIFRNGVNKLLYDMVTSHQLNVNKGRIQDGKQYLYTEIENTSYLPLVGDKFIFEYLPEACVDLDQTFAAYILSEFFKWLCKKKLTQIKVELYETKVDEDDYQN